MNARMILDRAEAIGMNPLEKLKLVRELKMIRTDIAGTGAGALAALKKMKLAVRLKEIRARLGVVNPAPGPALSAQEGPRNPTAKFYDFDPNRKPAQRKRENAAAMALLGQIDAGEVDSKTLTDVQKATLAKYSGTGGALVGADGKKGSAYEYYTPKPIAEGMWSLMRELGFAGGKVLDPSAGVGIFGGTAPVDSVVDAVELNETSGRINALVNQGPGYSVEVSAYEKVASATPDDLYDAVITNVPFGSVADRGGNELGDKRYQKEPLQNYFILRSLEKLKPGGLAAFITPPRCVSGKGGKEEELRSSASFMAEFLGAYRLPNSVFGSASADTITDVIVFRKYSREVMQKIEELREQNPALLIEANVLWPEFVGGRYFAGEGKRFVLGEFIPKNPNDFRPVDRVVSDQSIPNIAKLLTKFPDSRVNWALLDQAETQPIVYAEGDTLTQKGQTLQLKDGAWAVVASNEASPDMLALGGKMGTPLQAFSNGVTFAQATAYQQFMLDTSQALDMPDWVRGALSQLKNVADASERARYWNSGLVGMSVEFLLSQHRGDEAGFNYLEEFADLSAAMKRSASDARSCPGSVSGAIKSGMKALGVHYSKKSGYSGVWSGNVLADQADARTADQKFEGAKYSGQGLWVDRAEAAAIYGPDFDPVADPNWCLSDDGKRLAKADDYFIGSYGDMLGRLDAAALAVTDPELKGKLLAQRAEAEKRVERVDVSAVSFNLFSPYATMEEKAEFMRRFVSPHFAVAYDDETGKPYIESTLKKVETARDKLHKRMAQYLKNGTVTLGGAEVGDEKKAMTELRSMISTANEQFDGWCKTNPSIIGRLHNTANDPDRLYFRQTEDESPLVIPGLSGNVTPHGYQNAFIRRQGRTFGGINGFGVGLGKTLTALASVAYVQSIGAKKKTAFIVPNSVLSNWRKEATNVYGSMDECLFVGLDTNAKTGKSKVDSANYDRDLNIVLENRHSKIFMTMEAFQRLRLRDDTIAGYEKFMRSVDASFAESEDKKADEVTKGKAKRLVALLTEGKSGGTPYLEDMGIDSIVMDEAHCFPAGTMVDGVAIENLRVGDMVRSMCHATGRIEMRPVTALMSRTPDAMVRVFLSNGKSIACTPDHPFWTDSGEYLNASQLNNSLQVMMISLKEESHDNMRALPGGISIDARAKKQSAQKSRGEGLLQSGLQRSGKKSDENEISTDYSQLHGLHKGVHAQHGSGMEAQKRNEGGVLLLPDMCFKGDLCASRVSGGIQLTGSGGQAPSAGGATTSPEGSVQLHALPKTVYLDHGAEVGAKVGQAGLLPVLSSVSCSVGSGSTRATGASPECGGENAQESGFPEHPGSHRETNCIAPNNWSEGWNSQGANGATKAAFRCAGPSNGIQSEEHVEAGGWLQGGLQPGYSEPDCEAGNRDRWAGSPVLEGTGKGQEEGGGLEFVGVDRVEVIERTSDGRFGGVCGDGLVYDITVDGNHNFFAEGILVHNCFKNSATTVEFKSAKFLALAPSSLRGLDAQAKSWFIRGKTPSRDGVLLLTATPISNSPTEIYAMLSLAVGRDRVNDMAMGIKGADQFMEVMCRVESEEDETIDGMVRDTRIFKGLENVGVLRKALGDVATIKDSASVGQQVKVPDADEVSSPVALPDPPVLDTLMQYKSAFRYAIDAISERPENRGDAEAYAAVAAKFGEPMELIGHPFNLINKMTMLIMDPELDQRATFYQITAQKAKAEAVIKAFNARKFIEERARTGPHTGADAVVGKITRKDGEDKTEFLKIQVAARLDGQRIIIDTITPETQSAFEALADKEGLELDVTVPPKLAALLANITKEETSPRGIDSDGNATPRVKQLIFCDILPLHNKIKRLLTRRAGIPAGAIAIITGKQNNTPDEIMAVQDGFNADGADNKYRVVIANEKAEVGINLQRGTQAIHHLTIGFTPDSLTQRNGRGVRQGNKTERVTIYTYDADGTFDSHKRAMVNKKSGWIDKVMDVNGGDSVNVEGGMSREQLEALIDTVGDSDAMTRLQERLATKEREVRAVGVRAKQTVNIRTVQASQKFLADNPDAKAWAARKFGQYFSVKQQIRDVEIRLGNPKASATALVKNQNLLADLQARAGGLQTALTEALAIADNYGKPVSIDELLTNVVSGHHSKGTSMAENVMGAIVDGRYGFKITSNENSAITNEWQSEVDMTKAMIKQAKTAFTKQSKEDGGIPKQVMDAFSEGRGVIFDGKPVVDGSFIKMETGQLGVVTGGGLIIRAWGINGVTTESQLGSLRPPFAVILPGSADYDAILTDAAKIDDGIAAAGVALGSGVVGLTFSALVPAVSQRRTNTSLMQCSAVYSGLPAPHFCKVLNPELASASPVFAAIIADQSKLVKSYTKDGLGNGEFTVEATVPVVEISKEMQRAGPLRDLIAYARAHSMRMTLLDAAALDIRPAAVRTLAGRKDMPSFAEALTGATEEALRDAASKWATSTVPDIDVGDEDPLELLQWGEKAELQAAIKRVMAPPQVPVAEATLPDAGQPAPAPGMAKAGTIGDNDMVGITGNTRQWKDQIKSAAAMAGGKAIWDGAAEQWNVPYKAWTRLVDNNPACVFAGQLKVVEFSGKGSYGKRR